MQSQPKIVMYNVSQEQKQKEIPLEFREKPLNPAVITTFLRVILLYNTKD